MAPDVINWIAVFVLFLVAVWIGFLAIAFQWVLSHAVPIVGILAAVALVFVVLFDQSSVTER